MISILLTARQDSKFMAKFVMTYLTHTHDLNNVELLIMTPKGDWNKELFDFLKTYKLPHPITLVDDDSNLGRGGSHIFYKKLGDLAKGDWLWYACDDHYFYKDYDKYVSIFLDNLDPNKINVVVPSVENLGRISHIVSRKYFKTVGIAQHGNVDSYINDTLDYLEVFVGKDEVQKVLHPLSVPIMSDFSTDKTIMEPKNSPNFDPVKEAELFKSEITKEKIREDAHKLFEALKEENA